MRPSGSPESIAPTHPRVNGERRFLTLADLVRCGQQHVEADTTDVGLGDAVELARE
jgi:hypothetical protein